MMLGMKLSLIDAQLFLVIATDPEAQWRCKHVHVTAVSADEAKRSAPPASSWRSRSGTTGCFRAWRAAA